MIVSAAISFRHRFRDAHLLPVVLFVLAVLLTACSAGPESQPAESTASSTPSAAASSVAASSARSTASASSKASESAVRELEPESSAQQPAVLQGLVVEETGTFFYESGQKVFGAYEVDGARRYFDPGAHGTMVTGWFYHADQDAWTYYDTQGCLLVGEQVIDGERYYLDPETGARCYGWVDVPDQDKRVYCDPVEGFYWIGDREVDGVAYHFDEETGKAEERVAQDDAGDSQETPYQEGVVYQPAPSGDAAYAGFIDAVYATPYAGDSLCAAWVTNAYANAGASAPYGNACDMARAWWCSGTDLNTLEPGMVVAVESTHTAMGQIYGHVGIYLGNGEIMHNSSIFPAVTESGLAITPLDEWIAYYRNNCDVHFGWPNGVKPY